MRLIWIFAIALLAQGCSVQKLVKQPYPEIRQFLIEAEREGESASGQAGAPPLTMSRWTIAPQFDSRNFVYFEGGHRWSSDFYNEFFINPSENLTEEAIEWLRGSGLFSTVNIGPAGKGLHLEVQVTELHGDYSDPKKPTAVLRLSTTLKIDNARTVHKGEILRRAPLASAEASALVQGWSDALEEALRIIEASVKGRVN